MQWDEKELDTNFTLNVYFWIPNSEILAKALPTIHLSLILHTAVSAVRCSLTGLYPLNLRVGIFSSWNISWSTGQEIQISPIEDDHKSLKSYPTLSGKYDKK